MKSREIIIKIGGRKFLFLYVRVYFFFMLCAFIYILKKEILKYLILIFYVCVSKTKTCTTYVSYLSYSLLLCKIIRVIRVLLVPYANKKLKEYFWCALCVVVVCAKNKKKNKGVCVFFSIEALIFLLLSKYKLSLYFKIRQKYKHICDVHVVI